MGKLGGQQAFDKALQDGVLEPGSAQTMAAINMAVTAAVWKVPQMGLEQLQKPQHQLIILVAGPLTPVVWPEP